MGLLTAIVVFTGVIVMGATLLGALNPDRRLSRQNQLDHVHSQVKLRPVALDQFNQFEIEGQELAWPSAVTLHKARFEPLPWPSAGWDDEHFGQAYGGPVELAKLEQGMPRQATPPPPKKRKKNKAKNNTARKLQQHAQALREEAEDQFFGAVEQQRQALEADLGFDPAAVPAMVREHGLAGAVERIRSETGWEFKKAAQFVAKALRS